MAQPLQHRQTAFIFGIPPARATSIVADPVIARSGHANAIISLSRWYKISIRPIISNDSSKIAAQIDARTDVLCAIVNCA